MKGMSPHGSESEPKPRATCWRCLKPSPMCVCERTPRVPNRTRVFVLQHRRERAHAVGTARIARLGLQKVEVREAVGSLPRPELAPDAALLYPSVGAQDLNELSPRERPSQLVVLDGTWRHARRLFLDNPWLSEMPHVRLTPTEPSRYRIRKQPAEHCVSTLESLVAALGILEPETAGLDGLLASFDSMIDEQQAFMENPSSTPRWQRREPRESRALPPDLVESFERLVVVYGESAPVGERGDARCKRRQLVRWSALRPATGEVFDRLIQPEGTPPLRGHLEHMGLDPEQFSAAQPMPLVCEGWRAFRCADDLLAAWHPAMLKMLNWIDPAPARTLLLRALWSNITHARPGGLADLVEERGLVVEPVPLPGRSALRLGEAVAVAHELLRTAPRLAHLPHK
jgi:DTW domain-containing protein